MILDSDVTLLRLAGQLGTLEGDLVDDLTIEPNGDLPLFAFGSQSVPLPRRLGGVRGGINAWQDAARGAVGAKLVFASAINDLHLNH